MTETPTIVSSFNSSLTINRLTEADYQQLSASGYFNETPGNEYHSFEFYATEDEGTSGGGGGGGGSQYVLPTAAANKLGGIKIGAAKDVAASKFPVELNNADQAYVSVDVESLSAKIVPAISSDMTSALSNDINSYADGRINAKLSVEELTFTLEDNTEYTVKLAAWTN